MKTTELQRTQSTLPASRQEPGPLTYGQEERIRNLEATQRQTGANAEQRDAARMEAEAIRSGKESRMSSADRSRRESLVADLQNGDLARRNSAMRELREIYSRTR